MRIVGKPLVCVLQLRHRRAGDGERHRVRRAGGRRVRREFEHLSRIEQGDARRVAPRDRRADRQFDRLLVPLAASDGNEAERELPRLGRRVRREAQNRRFAGRKADRPGCDALHGASVRHLVGDFAVLAGHVGEREG